MTLVLFLMRQSFYLKNANMTGTDFLFSMFGLVLLSHGNYIPITPCSVNNEMSIKVKTSLAQICVCLWVSLVKSRVGRHLTFTSITRAGPKTAHSVQ